MQWKTLALLTFALPAAAQTLVQTRDIENVSGLGTSLALAFANPVTPGNSFIAVCRVGDSQGTIALSDSNNGPWTNAVLANDPGNRSIAIAYFASTTAAGSPTPTVTCTWSPTATLNNQLTIFEYSGLNTSSMVDQETSTCPTAASTTPSSGIISNTNPNDLLLGAVTVASASTAAFTAEAAGYTTESTDSFGVGSHSHLHTADRIVTALGDYAYQPTLSAPESACAVIVAFNSAAPTVTTNPATGVLNTSASLNGSANPNLSATTGWFRYDVTAPAACNDSFGTRLPASGGTALGSGSTPVSYPQAVASLSAGTTYFFCALASNSVGTGTGAVLSFTTPSAPEVTTNPATSLGPTGATLNGRAKPNLSPTSGWFRYDVTNPGLCNDSFGTRVPQSGGTGLGAGNTPVPYPQATGILIPGSTYFFCAIASNSFGTSFGSVLSFTVPGTTIDAGFGHDAGLGTDAGADAGASSDAGPGADAGQGSDSGTAADGGGADGGAADAGGSTDGGTGGNPLNLAVGCSCGTASGSALLACLLAAALVRRRRYRN